MLWNPPQFSSISSRGPDGQTRDTPIPLPALSGPFPSSGHLVPLWSASHCQRPPHKPGVHRAAPSPVGRAATPWRRGARPPRVGLGLATRFLAGPGQGARQSSGAGTGDPGFPGSAHVCTVQRPSRPRPAQQAPVAGGTRQRHALGPTVSCPGPSPSGKSACETEKGIFYVECQCDFTCACARVLTQACVCV